MPSHSPTSAAFEPDASDPADGSATTGPLTRREVRERERAARAPVEVADARHTTHHDSGVVAVPVEPEILKPEILKPEILEPEILEPAILKPAIVEPKVAAPEIVAADRFESRTIEPAPVPGRLAEAPVTPDVHLPELDPTIPDTDRLIAAPAAAEAPVSDLDQLQTDVSPVTTSTPIQFPTRAQARARQAGSRSERPRPAPAAALPEEPLPASRPAAPQPGTFRLRATITAPTAAPRPPRVAKPTGGLGRRLATTGVTFVAMAFVALMAVSTSLPAEALLSSADVQAAARAAVQPTSTQASQTLTVSGTDTISVQRDGYVSQSLAEFAAASGIRMEATFTNNPNGTIQWPFAVGVKIGDRFGPRNCSGCSSNHQGQDFNPGVNAPIQAIADGVVSYAANEDGSLGTHMIIDHIINGKPVSSVYSHMVTGSMKFKAGDVVKVGQIVGKTGNTGMSTGPHLDLEIRIGGKDGTRVDPLAWLYANAN